LKLCKAFSGDGGLIGGGVARGAEKKLVKGLLGLTADEDFGGALGCS
jgi:hypothetical protein